MKNEKEYLEKEYLEEDVIREKVNHLIANRIPWLLLGVLGGFLVTIVVSKYEKILSSDIRLAFFIPIIVYLSDAVGTQTGTIYIRELSEKNRFDFSKYIFKESLVGLSLGIISGFSLGIFAFFWLKSVSIALTIGLTLLINLTVAPILSVAISNILYKKRSDPALGAGPVATIIQDFMSLFIYFILASIIIF